MAQNVTTFVPDLLYLGSDDYDTFGENGGPTWIQRWVELERTGVQDPLAPPGSPPLGVVLLIDNDGATRRALSGLSSASSTYPSEYSDATMAQIRDMSLLLPITRTAAAMKAAEPRAGASDGVRAAHARSDDARGVRGGNQLRAPFTKQPPCTLHLRMRSMGKWGTCFAQYLQASGGSLDAWIAHLTQCCAIRCRVVIIDSSGYVKMKTQGPQLRAMRDAGIKVCTQCDHHRFLPANAQETGAADAIKDNYSDLLWLLDALGETDLAQSRLDTESYPMVSLRYVVVFGILYGNKAITPSLRTVPDHVPFFRKVR